MSDPTLPTIDPIRYIRTNVPIAIGAALGWLITQFTIVAAALAWLDAQIPVIFPGTDWRALLNAAAIAAVTALYYWGASQIGKRWPKAEKWLLGSSKVPNYTAR